MIETINLIKDLRHYKAHVLAYPEIGNTDIKRDEFESDTGLIYYSKERSALTPVSFSVEFKGSKEEIRKNRNRLSRKLELAKVTFDNEVFYRGRFLGESVETRYFYEVVEFKGQSIAMLETQYNNIPIGERISIYNNGNLPTPCRLTFKGNGTDIKITGFKHPISFKYVDDKLVIDAERGLYNIGVGNPIELIEFPYIDDKIDLLVEGNGTFTCEMEFEGRIIC